MWKSRSLPRESAGAAFLGHLKEKQPVLDGIHVSGGGVPRKVRRPTRESVMEQVEGLADARKSVLKLTKELSSPAGPVIGRITRAVEQRADEARSGLEFIVERFVEFAAVSRETGRESLAPTRSQLIGYSGEGGADLPKVIDRQCRRHVTWRCHASTALLEPLRSTDVNDTSDR